MFWNAEKRGLKVTSQPRISAASPFRPTALSLFAQIAYLAAVTGPNTIEYPLAERRPHDVDSPHGKRLDPYYWLRDDERQDPKVLDYLKQENEYRSKMMAPVADLEKQLFEEIVGRIKTDDESPPYRDRGYLYSSRFTEKNEYPVYLRKPLRSEDEPEEVLIDGNARSEGHDYYELASFEVSPKGNLLAVAEDTVGRRQHEIRIKDLESETFYPEVIKNASDDLVWAADNKSLFYVENDPVTLLGMRVKCHRLGDKVEHDRLVYEEKDHAFYLHLHSSSDHRHMILHLGSTLSDEVRTLSSQDPGGNFEIFTAREANHEYAIDHCNDRWIIRTNWQAENFRLMQLEDGRPHSKDHWQELIPHSPDVYIADISLFNEYLVINERSDGLQRIKIRSWDGSHEEFVHSDEAAYSMSLGTNLEQDTPWLRYHYTSLTTPHSVLEINMQSGEKRLLKQQEVLGGFKREDYITERLWCTARDGSRIPVSLLFRRDLERGETHPLYQYAYGSYGSSTEPDFMSSMLSLVDRGFIFAIAHVRGGQEMGRRWYDEGRRFKKRNTFTDFIDVSEFLIAEGYTSPKQLVLSGGSAGGLLVGSVVNMRSDLYAVAIADVPFVDVVTTMLDETIPLTSNEFDEWGNPQEQTDYEYMLSYSPYDNVQEQDYPAMLVTTGLWDSQVQYFEPAKWVAKLRRHKTDKQALLLHTHMDAGHGGLSGRFRQQKDRALEFAFILQQLQPSSKNQHTSS